MPSYAYVNSFTNTYVAWTESGASPYLEAIGGGSIATATNLAKEGNFGFPATSGVTALEFYAKISNAAGDDGVLVQTELGGESFFPTSTSYQWYSVSKSDDSGFSVTYANGLSTPHRTITIDAARLVYSAGGGQELFCLHNAMGYHKRFNPEWLLHILGSMGLLRP